MTRRARAALAALALSIAASPAAEAMANGAARVVLIVVDGLDARDVGEEQTPNLARHWRTARWCPGAHGRAEMPARTNVNHASLLTGVRPEAHGITGNAFWGRGAEAPRKLGVAADLLTETLFTVARRTRPALRTAAAVGKAKLELMFAASPGRQDAPSATFGPKDLPERERDRTTGYAFDGALVAGARTLAARGVDFMLVNLADVDRVSHGAGPHSPSAASARRATDVAVETLLAALAIDPAWPRTVVVITADHGFDTIVHPPVAFDAVARTADLGKAIVSVGDGGVGHVYLRPGASPAVLAGVRRLAVATPGIAEALYLASNDEDGGRAHTLAEVHPEWHLAQERAGDLMLIAATGWVLVDGGGDEGVLKGNHGAPAELDVPVIVVRGVDDVPGEHCDAITAAALGRTLQHCVGLRDVAGVDGSTVPSTARGEVLSGLCPRARAEGDGR